jgi:molecular chaperone GrpE
MKHQSKEKPEQERRTKSKESELEELRQQWQDLQKEKDEVFEKLQRVSADYANFQKRVPKQIADTIVYEKENIIKTLLPVLDNFEHTLQNAGSAADAEVLVKGVRIIYDQMLDILKLHGVEQIDALGEGFDPALHEAMMRREEADRDENIVLEEFQKGYKLNGRVIRPSKVIVNAPAEPQNVKEEPDQAKADLKQQATDDTDNEE